MFPRATSMDLRDKVVAITGGARGIGRSTAMAFLARGAQVAIGDIDVELVTATAAEVGAGHHSRLIGLPLDVSDRASFARFLDATEQHLGALDVLVNNAGIMPTGPHVDELDATTDRQIAVNVIGVVTGSKLAAHRFVERGKGHIINIASLAALSPTAGLSTYCGTKSFVRSYTETLHRELRPSGVGVTAVLPGVVRTELSSGAKVPPWADRLAVVDPSDIASRVVAVAGTSRVVVTCPAMMGTALRAVSMLPTATRLRVERLSGLAELMSAADPATRSEYHKRIRIVT